MNAKQVRRVISGVVVAVGVVFGSGSAEASSLVVDGIAASTALDDGVAEEVVDAFEGELELPSVDSELLVTAEASVPAPFIVQFSAEFEVAFSVLMSSGAPDAAPDADLSCARGCVLEYNACMWTEYDFSCGGELDLCSMTCGE